MYFESHAHFDDRKFNDDRTQLLGTQLKESGVDYVVNAGANMRSSLEGIKLSEKYDYFYAGVGCHPHDAKSLKESDMDSLVKWSAHDKVVAIGEIGLDFHYDFSPRDVQLKWFLRQLDIAKEVKLPVIIHSRESDQQVFDVLKKSGAGETIGGVVHCFSGSKEMALEYVKMGFYIGVGGVVTYSNARKLVEVVEAVSIDNILIETDSPYLSPVPNRGNRNDSRNLRYVCEKIGQIKQIPHDEVAFKTMENAKTLFNIK